MTISMQACFVCQTKLKFSCSLELLMVEAGREVTRGRESTAGFLWLRSCVVSQGVGKPAHLERLTPKTKTAI